MILVIGDLHFRESMPYADYISDRRVGEKQEVLDFIVDQAKDCESVVLVGDALNLRNNPSEVIREFVAFIERFKDKELYIIAGNHEKKGNGKTAIDFLGEIGNKKWHIMARPTHFVINGKKIDFLPYMTKYELGVKTNEEATEEVLNHIQGGDILFHHHAVSDTVSNGTSTELFNEIVLPKDKLESKYKCVIGGHIHTPGVYGRTWVTGSVFNSDMGETQKFIWKVDELKGQVTKIALPGRGIYKLENPTAEQIDAVPVHNIVKVIVTDKSLNVEALRKQLQRFDAFLVVEQYENERQKVHFEDGAIDLDLSNLLTIYAQARKIDIDLLNKGYDLIKE